MVDNRQGERNYPVRAQAYFRVTKFMKLVKSAMGGEQAVMTRRIGYLSGSPPQTPVGPPRNKFPLSKGSM